MRAIDGARPKLLAPSGQYDGWLRPPDAADEEQA
jgi:hypothetical protein